MVSDALIKFTLNAFNALALIRYAKNRHETEFAE